VIGTLGYAMPICVCVVSFSRWARLCAVRPSASADGSGAVQSPNSRPIWSRSGFHSMLPATEMMVPRGVNRRR
jgi:hypothetical protein